MATEPSEPPAASPFDDTEVPQSLVGRPEPASEGQRDRVRAALFDDRPLPPERLGRFIVLGSLGQGGMGTVLEAFDPTLDRKIALKVLHPEVAQRHAQRLVREAKGLAKLSHPNVVQVYEVGEAQGRTFIAMELVAGQTLQAWQRQEPRPSWRQCVEVYLQAGRGLAAAHAAGLVHRDFKPENCIIDDEGRVRVLDFGLVRQIDGSTGEALTVSGGRPRETSDQSDASLTRTGAVLGTLAYMPLEQLEGQAVDALSDQFSFCVSLYDAVYGERPFGGDTLGTLTEALVEGTVRGAPAGSAVPSKLRGRLVRGLARTPSERWPSMGALLDELERLVAPRRGRWMGLALAGGLVAVGAGIWARPEVAPVTVQERCEGVEARLVGIWDDSRRQEVEAAIVQTDKPFALDTWQRVESQLDDYSSAWVTKYEQVCEAAGSIGERAPEDTARQFDCLGKRFSALRDVVDVLAGIDGTTVDKALDVIHSLPRLERCDDLEALAAAIAPPEDPDVAAEVADLRERLSSAAVRELAGKYDQQRAQAVEIVLERAEAIGYTPLVAEALFHEGQVLRTKAQYDDSRRVLERAYALAVEDGHDVVATDAAFELMMVLGVDQAHPEQGLQWGQTALAMASRPTVDKTKKPWIIGRIGFLLQQQGKDEEALSHAQRALAMLEALLGPEHPEVASQLYATAGMLRLQGRLDEALEYYRRSLRIYESASGPSHPGMQYPLNNISLVFMDRGDYDSALEYLYRSVAIAQQEAGSDHPVLVVPLKNISRALRHQGKLDESEDYARRALKIDEAALGDLHPDLAYSLHNLSATLQAQGKLDEARQCLERALAITEATFGAEDLRTAQDLDGLMDLLFHQGTLEESTKLAQRSLAIKENRLGAEHPAVADGLRMLGDNLHKSGQLEEALASYERALPIMEAAVGSDHPDLVLYLWSIGATLQAQGDLDGALAWFQRALSIVDSADDVFPVDASIVLRGIAEIELRQRNIDRAVEHAERAVTVLERGGRWPTDLAEARLVLARALWRREGQRARAVAEATLAELKDDQGLGVQERLEEIQEWLERHPLPAAR